MLVYGLYSTRNYEVRYVGSTKDLPRRVKAHIAKARSRAETSVKSDWIVQELSDGFAIAAIVLCHNARPQVDEQRFIDAFRLVQGNRSLNTVSGEWASCRVTEGQQKAKAAGIHIGRPPMADACRERIERLTNEGLSIRQIAQETGLSTATVKRVRKKQRESCAV
jgi:hypothetical protein